MQQRDANIEADTGAHLERFSSLAKRCGTVPAASKPFTFYIDTAVSGRSFPPKSAMATCPVPRVLVTRLQIIR